MAWQQQLLRVVSASACVAIISACSSPARTATNFCRQLANELPEIADLPATDEQISDAVKRYERLLEVAPLEIEREFESLTALMRAAREQQGRQAEVLHRVQTGQRMTEGLARFEAFWQGGRLDRPPVSLGIEHKHSLRAPRSNHGWQTTAGTSRSAISALLASQTAGCQVVKPNCSRWTSMLAVMLLPIALAR